MKKAMLEKLKGKRITGGGFGRKDRYGKGSSAGAEAPEEKRLAGVTAGLLQGWVKKK
ncbi:MAG TPA: hypothetical protein VFD95_02025 [Usitatibacter sp.]|jgi:hypothetical protein|nr:hypothetical protein [Usitatibacter sp.]